MATTRSALSRTHSLNRIVGSRTSLAMPSPALSNAVASATTWPAASFAPTADRDIAHASTAQASPAARWSGPWEASASPVTMPPWRASAVSATQRLGPRFLDDPRRAAPRHRHLDRTHLPSRRSSRLSRPVDPHRLQGPPSPRQPSIPPDNPTRHLILRQAPLATEAPGNARLDLLELADLDGFLSPFSTRPSELSPWTPHRPGCA
jgi:hypothetical protein